MVKTILYTSNPTFVPTNLDQVVNFANENCKFYVCYAAEDSKIGKLQVGAHVVSAKGNHIYVLEVVNGNVERDFAKKCNITNYISVDYPFAEFQPVKTTNKTSNNMKENSIKGITARIKEMFMPTEAKDVRLATDGSICVATNQGYVSIDAENRLTSYPAELTLPLPVFIISKPKEQLAVGDVIALDRSYAKVVKIDGDKISAIGYTGAGKTIHTIKDFLFNQTMVRVVISLAGNIGGQINPMLLMALSDKNDKDSLLPLLMMSQQNGAVGMNPMLLMMLADKDGGSSMKDMLLMSAIGGGNPFNGLFGTNQCACSKKASQPVEVPVEVPVAE